MCKLQTHLLKLQETCLTHRHTDSVHNNWYDLLSKRPQASQVDTVCSNWRGSELGLHRISYPAPAGIRPFFKSGPGRIWPPDLRPDLSNFEDPNITTFQFIFLRLHRCTLHLLPPACHLKDCSVWLGTSLANIVHASTQTMLKNWFSWSTMLPSLDLHMARHLSRLIDLQCMLTFDLDFRLWDLTLLEFDTSLLTVCVFTFFLSSEQFQV